MIIEILRDALALRRQVAAMPKRRRRRSFELYSIDPKTGRMTDAALREAILAGRDHERALESSRKVARELGWSEKDIAKYLRAD